MEGHATRDTRLTLRRFWTTPFQYTLLVASVLSAKLLHLYNHISSLPPVLFILYLPTFLALDVVIVIAFWLLVHVTAHGRAWILLALVRSSICLVILEASSIQIAFYLETGGEIKWGAADNFVSDPAAMKLLLSGGVYVISVSLVIIGVSFLVCQRLYDGTHALLSNLIRAFAKRHPRQVTHPKYLLDGPIAPESIPSANCRSSEEDDLEHSCQYTDTVLFETETLLVDTNQTGRYSQWISRIKFLVPFGVVLLLLCVRPRNPPFAHMSGTLPFTLRDIWGFYSEGLCQEGSSREFDVFPLPELISSRYWEQPKGKYTGWVPAANMSSMVEQDNRQPPLPSWLPGEKMHGFERWYGRDDQPKTLSHSPKMSGKGIEEEVYERVTYDPARDPLRITNLDNDLLQPITDALVGREIPIKHVVIVHLESTRKDVFPLKKGSHLHNLIMQSHTSNESMTIVNKKLSNLTVNAEQLTGEGSGFQSSKDSGSITGSGAWRELGGDRGGINVVGAFTGSTTTFKSMVGSHCGAQPLPVDFTVEARGNIYQPCIPDILKLFNHNKKLRKEVSRGIFGKGEFNSKPWKSVFVQSITDLYDHQDELNQHMGFDHVIVKSTLDDPSSKYYPPTEKESNYFGYPESQVKNYMRDLFVDAEKSGERLFLSHFTSSTHHPWNVPEEAADESFDFLKRGRWRSEHQLNRYLNTIKYGDRWIGELMDMLEEVGVAKETLVVMIGDHGMAFEEDSKKHSTFENGHISNIRVPLLFHHPSLPRIQLAVNVTSISVIPTILDLLTATSSLNTQDADIASNLIHQYEGQSLLRPYQVSKNGRQAWIVTVLNAGGAILSVSSAAVPHRLVLPVCKSDVYRFTSTDRDPNELHPIEEYSIERLAARVAKELEDDDAAAAAKWVLDAEKIGKWWVGEQRRRWRYTGASLQDDRKPEELRGAGTVQKEHWWNT